MAATSDSGEAADIFWPGYVDAVTNLAINLLFVIYLSSLILIVSTMTVGNLVTKFRIGSISVVNYKKFKKFCTKSHD